MSNSNVLNATFFSSVLNRENVPCEKKKKNSKQNLGILRVDNDQE